MRAATAARRDGITLLAVGVTTNIKRTELKAIASYPMRSNVFRIPNYYSFINIKNGLKRAACNGLYCSPIQLEVKNRPTVRILYIPCRPTEAIVFHILVDFRRYRPKWPTLVDLSVGDIRRQIGAEWLEIAQWSQWRAYRKPPTPFRMVLSTTSYDFPFSQNGSPKCTTQDQLRDACCHLTNMIETIDPISFAH